VNKHEINLISWFIETMEPMRDSPDREKFCVGFDKEYLRLKKIYKEETGKEWEGK
jgi:hypothetical protein